jgi:hypothetical protein
MRYTLSFTNASEAHVANTIESETPLPIPDVGETIWEPVGGIWLLIVARVFAFTQTSCAIRLVCEVVKDHPQSIKRS